MKILAALIAFAVLLLAAIGAAKLWLLPQWIEQEIRHALAARGLNESSLKIERIGWRQALIKNAQIGTSDSLFIGEIEIDYDAATLRQHRVHTAHIKKAYLALAIQNGEVNFGPLEGYVSTGPLALPFDLLRLSDCTLKIDWEGMVLHAPITAEIRPLAADSIALALHATPAGGNLGLQAVFGLDPLRGAGNVSIEGLDADLLQHARELHLPEATLAASGRWGLEASFARQRERWFLRGRLDGDALRLTYTSTAMNHPLKAGNLQARFDLRSDSLNTVTFTGLVHQTPATLTAAFDWKTRQLSGKFKIPALAAGVLNQFSEGFAAPLKWRSQGRLAVAGNFSLPFHGQGGLQVSLAGDGFSAQLQGPSYHLDWWPQRIAAQARFSRTETKTTLTHATLHLQELSLREDTLEVQLQGLNATLPVNWREQTISAGTFSVGAARWRALELSALAGNLQWQGRRWQFEASSRFLENARLDLSAGLDLSQEKIAGEVIAQVPAFTLHNSAALIPLFPALRHGTLTGIFEFTGRVQTAESGFVSHIFLRAQTAAWHSKVSEATVADISGALEINSIAPLTSTGVQRFTFATARFGDLDLTDGELLLAIADWDSLLVESISCAWAGGRLTSRNLVVKPSAARVDFVLQAEALDLQAILDFIRYQGVKGQGKIYGELPITLQWGEKRRLSFGDGYLEARPQAGVLQLSPENAQALMGVRQPIDPDNASLEEQVSMMVINALQDMAYTNLRVEFKNEPGRGLMTYVRAQGYGPRHDREKQIPIGGFNVNINHLDDLLNSMIWTNLGAGKSN